MGSEYLNFIEGVSKTGKTKIVNVYSKRHGDWLAQIRWFGRWRQYALFPEKGTVFNLNCLNDIRDEITRLMSEWKGRTTVDVWVKR